MRLMGVPQATRLQRLILEAIQEAIVLDAHIFIVLWPMRLLENLRAF